MMTKTRPEAAVGGLVPAHHAVDAGPRLSGGDPESGGGGGTTGGKGAISAGTKG